MIRTALMVSLLIAGACSFYEATLHGWEYYQLVTADRVTVGRVLSRRLLDGEGDFDHTVTYLYRYSQTTGGAPYTVMKEQGVEQATFHTMHPGDLVRVVYWSGDPTRTNLEGNHADLPRALMRGAVGMFFMGVGAWGLRRRRKPFLELPSRR